MRQIEIWKQLTNPGQRPYRLVEVYQTVDGARSRLSNKCFKSQDEAQFEKNRLEVEP